jgi:hypothetical protein
MAILTFAPSLEQIAPLVNSQFMVDTSAGPYPLTLVRAEHLRRFNLPDRFRTPLSLIFVGPYTPRLSDNTYGFNHPSLGRREWHVSQVRLNAPGIALPADAVTGDGPPVFYEVMFN